MLIGVVGKPNVGKSTFFAAATLTDVKIANYPFTTIDPNIGIAYVRVSCPCKEFNVKCNPQNSFCIRGNRFVPVQLIDVAGLVPDAHKGKGLGNKFLDDLRQADVLLHIVDMSGKTDFEGNSCDEHDPLEDIIFLEKEIDYWLLEILKRNWTKIARKAQSDNEDFIKLLAKSYSGLGITELMLKEISKNIDFSNAVKWSDEELLNFCSLVRKLTKPIIVVGNKMDLSDSWKNYERIKSKGYDIIPISAEAELILRKASNAGLVEYIPGDSDFNVVGSLNEKQVNALELIRAFLKRNKTTGVQKALNHAVFDVLRYIVVYPVENEEKLCDTNGNILPDAILIKDGSTARDLAYKIHTDLGKNFITAIDVRKKMNVGADYRLKNGDIIKIIANA